MYQLYTLHICFPKRDQEWRNSTKLTCYSSSPPANFILPKPSNPSQGKKLYRKCQEGGRHHINFFFLWQQWPTIYACYRYAAHLLGLSIKEDNWHVYLQIIYIYTYICNMRQNNWTLIPLRINFIKQSKFSPTKWLNMLIVILWISFANSANW